MQCAVARPRFGLQPPRRAMRAALPSALKIYGSPGSRSRIPEW